MENRKTVLTVANREAR